MNQPLTNRVALVTGASRGLGAAIATSLARSGAKVAVNYFGSPEKAEHVASQIRSSGGQAIAVKADVRDESQVKQMVEEVQSKLGLIDILVPNATGPQPSVKIEDL